MRPRPRQPPAPPRNLPHRPRPPLLRRPKTPRNLRDPRSPRIHHPLTHRRRPFPNHTHSRTTTKTKTISPTRPMNTHLTDEQRLAYLEGQASSETAAHL